jgi:hypothetical protein
MDRLDAQPQTSPPYTVDLDRLQRFDARHTAFGVVHRQEPEHSGDPELVTESEVGAVARAEMVAARTVHHHFTGAYGGERLSRTDRAVPTSSPFASSQEASAAVKAAARRFGATLVGIAEVNPLWLYACDRQGAALSLPAEVKWAVVTAVTMDRKQIELSPGTPAAVATGRGYSDMAMVASSMAEFIRLLGFQAISSGNDTALSIPLAIDAGLGVMGRSGLLLTESHGACIRLCKVFTDLPLVPDAPLADGCESRCAQCRLCARACPAQAISKAPEPSFDVCGPTNNPGVRRWPIDGVRCLRFWHQNGASCSTCIAVCPYQG